MYTTEQRLRAARNEARALRLLRAGEQKKDLLRRMRIGRAMQQKEETLRRLRLRRAKEQKEETLLKLRSHGKNIVVAGSRHLHLDDFEWKRIFRENGISKMDRIISGGAVGIDKSVEGFCRRNGYHNDIYPADWSMGRSAGPIRNGQMARLGQKLILIWDGRTKGSANMKRSMEEVGKEVVEYVSNIKSFE